MSGQGGRLKPPVRVRAFVRTYTAKADQQIALREKITRFLQSQEDVMLAFLHGSFLEGRFRDIDVAVILNPGVPEMEHVEAQIERELREIIGYPVDLRRLNDAPLLFRYEVLAHGEVLVSKDEDLRVEFQCRTLALYHDFSHHIRSYQREVLGFGV